LACGSWIISGACGLTLVCTKPAADCAALEFKCRGFEIGPAAEKLVPPFDPAKYMAFAVQGKTAVRFLPKEFHGVYGDVPLEPADSKTVYVYLCDKRYFQMVVGN
jgi:hypothetical protein